MIELRGITKSYGTGEAMVRALDGVDFSVDRGDFIAVMGPSGSGKSTTMNIIGCLDTPSSGQYLLMGQEVGGLDRDQRALLRRNFLGFIFQGFNLLPRTTALENVELPLVYQGVPQDERRERALAALGKVGLADRAGHKPSELSGGQQQRVAIARAIVTRPQLILADEPTGNLDSARSREIMLLLQQLNRDEGMTVLMVTHEPDMAAYATRVATFVDGRLQSDIRQDAH
ncbi:ABC transporter ATP-binding protein [Stagnihabitans tardus]|uniref:ATP-binding cassette domain-containing protein n=1 Tax=Stagnihabitans tardus TaxID=2699202 RepID=A0AAE4Y7Q5_9RHOB|nr:ABC transporter ATP-binding protein [Stagnihabitans tardus]NBZ87421.1 ATP-binding cassette domain-containing protein [Stagnihabitans tardus]